MKEIKIHNKSFILYITAEQIQETVRRLGRELSTEFQGKRPVFVGVLNGGAFIMGDLLKNFDGECEVSFIRLASYNDMRSSGKVKTLIDFQEDFSNRDVIIVEDIIDTGNTLEELYKKIRQQKISSCTIVSMFLKPGVYKKDLKIDKIGIEISDKFVVGYGSDYNGLGRNLPSLYQLKTDA